MGNEEKGMRLLVARNNLQLLAEAGFLCLALISGCVLGWAMFGEEHNLMVMSVSGLLFTLFLLLTLAFMFEPDHLKAKQSLLVLDVASQTLEAMRDGYDTNSAQKVCELLLPNVSACAVAMTDNKVVLGYCGIGRADLGRLGGRIRTVATASTVKDGKTRVLRSEAEVGLPKPVKGIRAAIIVPLTEGKDTLGTLKFYYSNASRISESQVSIAEGFGQLLSTQIAALRLEDQKKLATSMELKALQSQINPHFLFNTINTMASYCRIDPDKARVMLREFATFYRATLENSSDLISLEREVAQTVRYLRLEQCRFGEDRLAIEVDVPAELGELEVPSFMIQPLVENSIKHAFPAEGELTIGIRSERRGDDILVYVTDNGVGMTEEALDNILHPVSETGLGIAVKNVNDRLRGYFGEGSKMTIESELGKGTFVTLFLKGCACRLDREHEKEEDLADEFAQLKKEAKEETSLRNLSKGSGEKEDFIDLADLKI
ncbi:MAG: histidine kinase [Coriobacteriia bacterium]|nr:histidine kinase [Coriobacteriia bacterium]